MVTRSPDGTDIPPPSALVLRHIENMYGAHGAPAAAIIRLSRQDQWSDALPRLSDLAPEGRALAADFRALSPDLRGALLAFALQEDVRVAPLDRAAAAASGFVDVERMGLVTWTSPLHRLAVVAGSEPDDHGVAGRACFSGPLSAHGGALHLFFAGEPVDIADLLAAADYFARADRPPWAVFCLVRAAQTTASPALAASLAARAANTAVFDGDFGMADRVLETFMFSDTRVLIRESAPARGLRQALLEGDSVAARETVLARLREDGLDDQAVGEALTVYALATIVDGDPQAWEGFLQACSTAVVRLHPAITAIAATIVAPDIAFEPHLTFPTAPDGRGWSQLAGCVAALLQTYRDMRRGTSAPCGELPTGAGNRLVRTVAATWESIIRAYNQHWDRLDTVVRIGMETTETVPIPLMRISAETLLALAEAFRGQGDTAKERVDRIRADPVLRRAYRLRIVLDSVEVMIEGPRGNHEHALALLSTREPDVLDLTAGPYGPVELFDFVDYAMLLQRDEDAVERVERTRELLRPHRLERAEFVLAACDAALALQRDLRPAEDLLARAQTHPFVYESARLRLVYAERLRRMNRTAAARRHLFRVEHELRSVQAGAWLDRVHRELRACQREIAVQVGDLTDQESRIAELAAEGLSNKQIAARLYLSPRTVGGHLYKIFPKLGVTTRAQLRDALSEGARAARGPRSADDGTAPAAG